MSVLLALDPGPAVTGLVVYDTQAQRVLRADGMAKNDDVLQQVAQAAQLGVEHLAIEMIASYGMAVGAEVFNTCVWVGRFMQAWRGAATVELVYRADVKLLLCGTNAAKDANVRQAILGRFPGAGAGSVPQVGTKKQPGPLYGVSAHAWSALAVALASAQGVGHVYQGAEIKPLHPEVWASIRPIKK